MYRRIEMLIDDYKGGIMCSQTFEVFDSWADMKGPKGDGIGKNCRYFFTEYGWKKMGRKVIEACQRTNQEYRIIKVKEKSVDVVYKDEIQVAVRPRKRRSHE